MIDLAVKRQNRSHDRRAHKRILKTRHEIHRLKVFFERGIGISHLQLILKVAHRPQATDDDIGIELIGEIDKKTLEADHIDFRQISRSRLGHLDPLLEAEHRPLRTRIGHSNDNLIKHRTRPPNNIKVPDGDRVKRTRIDRAGHWRSPAEVLVGRE